MQRTFSTCLILLIAVVAEPSCADDLSSPGDRSKLAKQARDRLVGLTVAELLACAGPPISIEHRDGAEHHLYAAAADQARRMALTSVRRYQRYCEVNFVVADGAVTAVHYAGRTGGLMSRWEQCAFVVAPCLDR